MRQVALFLVRHSAFSSVVLVLYPHAIALVIRNILTGGWTITSREPSEVTIDRWLGKLGSWFPIRGRVASALHRLATRWQSTDPPALLASYMLLIARFRVKESFSYVYHLAHTRSHVATWFGDQSLHRRILQTLISLTHLVSSVDRERVVALLRRDLDLKARSPRGVLEAPFATVCWRGLFELNGKAMENLPKILRVHLRGETKEAFALTLNNVIRYMDVPTHCRELSQAWPLLTLKEKWAYLNALTDLRYSALRIGEHILLWDTGRPDSPPGFLWEALAHEPELKEEMEPVTVETGSWRESSEAFRPRVVGIIERLLAEISPAAGSQVEAHVRGRQS